jgi:putative ABC transport system ATP-binding protein
MKNIAGHTIQLNHVIPNYITPSSAPVSDIWDKALTFELGKNYLIQAHSGTGKSTFLSILYGLKKNYKGEVLFGQQNIKTFSPNDWAAMRSNHLSIVFQDLQLLPNYTALENILLKALLYGKPDTARIEQMANQLNVAHTLHRKCKKLSFGEQQRMAIIRALTQPFEWLLLDEPFSHLDEKHIALASELIQAECEQRKAGMIVASLGYKYLFQYHQELNL